MTLVFFLTVAITALDPAGITRYIPDASQISSVHLSPYASEYYLDYDPLFLSDAEDIQNVLDIHAQILEDRYPEDSVMTLRMRYNLRNGATVERTYYVESESTIGQRLENYFSDFYHVTKAQSPEELASKIQYAEFYSHNDLPCMVFGDNGDVPADVVFEKYEDGWVYYTDEESQSILLGLAEAIYKDCQAGNMAQNIDFHWDEETVGNLVICISQTRYSNEYLDITVYPRGEHTTNYLKSLNP